MPLSCHLCAEHTCTVNSDLLVLVRVISVPLQSMIRCSDSTTPTTNPLPVAPQTALFHPTSTPCTSTELSEVEEDELSEIHVKDQLKRLVERANDLSPSALLAGLREVEASAPKLQQRAIGQPEVAVSPEQVDDSTADQAKSSTPSITRIERAAGRAKAEVSTNRSLV